MAWVKGIKGQKMRTVFIIAPAIVASLLVGGGALLSTVSDSQLSPQVEEIANGPVRLMVTEGSEGRTPRNFRTMASAFKPSLDLLLRYPSTTGLKELRASGSGQHTELSFEKLFAEIPAKREEVIVVDLRQESHGFFDSTSVVWYGKHNWANRGRTPQEIYFKEAKLLSDAARQGSALVYLSKKEAEPTALYVDSAETEEQWSNRHHIRYRRFYVPDGAYPDDVEVDHFVALLKQLSPTDWVHFHCAAGIGRTTLFLTIFDIAYNAQKVPLKDILVRQSLLLGRGGNYLTKREKSADKEEDTRERYNFIKQFYKYSRENPGFEKKWSDWVKENPY